jgi:hypothetical protein
MSKCPPSRALPSIEQQLSFSSSSVLATQSVECSYSQVAESRRTLYSKPWRQWSSISMAQPVPGTTSGSVSVSGHW